MKKFGNLARPHTVPVFLFRLPQARWSKIHGRAGNGEGREYSHTLTIERPAFAHTSSSPPKRERPLTTPELPPMWSSHRLATATKALWGLLQGIPGASREPKACLTARTRKEEKKKRRKEKKKKEKKKSPHEQVGGQTRFVVSCRKWVSLNQRSR